MWDQPEIANEMDYRELAQELIQFRRGERHCSLGITLTLYLQDNIGKPTGQGPTVIATPEAMRTELAEVSTTRY